MLNADSIHIWLVDFCDEMFMLMMNAEERDECSNFRFQNAHRSILPCLACEFRVCGAMNQSHNATHLSETQRFT